MKICNRTVRDTEVGKSIVYINREPLKPEDKVMLAVAICNAYHTGEIQDGVFATSALKEIVLSLLSIPEPIKIIDGKKILRSYPAGDRDIVLAAWGNEYVTWQLLRDGRNHRRGKSEFILGHYFHIKDFGSREEAYLAALRDFRLRF